MNNKSANADNADGDGERRQRNDFRNYRHLPECPVPEMDGLWGLPMHPEDAKANCICPSLRACEQRVRENERQKIRTSYLTGIQVSEVNKAYVSGYSRALDAAREAVAALIPRFTQTDGWLMGQEIWAALDIALAAIDALREETR